MGKKKKKKLIDKIKVGDKLWSIPHGWVTVSMFKNGPYPIVTKSKDGLSRTFSSSGKYYSDSTQEVLFKHKMRIVRAGKSDLSGVKVGDKVKCVVRGKGTVTSIYNNIIIVDFKNGDIDAFYYDGRHSKSDKHPSLYLLDD